ncbi:MAG TPA: response regulator, partial [Chloroflexota bacterium]|nr:response regulator [Chloroflexota bacterium]
MKRAATPFVICALADPVVNSLARQLSGATFVAVQTVGQALDLLLDRSCNLLIIDHSLLGDQATHLINVARVELGMSGVPIIYVVPKDRDPGLLRELVDELVISQVLFQPVDIAELIYQISRTLGIAGHDPIARDQTGEASRAEVQSAVATLWERFRSTNLERVEILEQATHDILTGTLPIEARREAERAAHKLAGAVGSFGFPTAALTARQIEMLLAGDTALSPDEVMRLADLVIRLRVELERPAPPGSVAVDQSVSDTAGDSLGRILLVTADAELDEQVTTEAQQRSLDVDHATTMAEARVRIACQRPDVVLLDLAPSEGSDAGLALLAELSNQEPPLPVVVLTQRNSLIDRVEVAILGGSGFLEKPLLPTQIIDTLYDVVESNRATESVILAVDDDPSILAWLRATLEPHGLRMVGLDDPLRFWSEIEETVPDLVILDVDMPHISGIELCKVLRNEQRWRALPVLVLTALTDPSTVHRVFAAGADDFVSKPIVGPELITRIDNRLERNRLHQRLAEIDVLTGVANRRKSSQAIEQLLRFARRRGDPLALAILDLDHFKQINDQYGHVAGDTTLRRLGELLGHSFRKEDVVGRWGGEEFVVALYGVSRSGAERRIMDVLDHFHHQRFTSPAGREYQASFSAGLAFFPDDGGDIASLYRAADRALYQA